MTSNTPLPTLELNSDDYINVIVIQNYNVQTVLTQKEKKSKLILFCCLLLIDDLKKTPII